MYQPWTTEGFQRHPAEPVETEEGGHFLSFAKRSREVHRCSAVNTRAPARDFHQSSSLSQYDEEFWEKILRYPSNNATYYDPYCGDSFNFFSREPSEMVCRGVTGSREENLSVHTLPSPSQLMGRRKKGGGQRGDSAQRQVAAVTQHIDDLRRKQSTIEQMKKEKWWGWTLGYTAQNNSCFNIGNQTPPETRWSLETHAPYTSRSPTHLNTKAVNPRVFGGCEEVMDLVPGGNPMMSFVVTGTAHRETQRSWDTPCLDTLYVATPHLETPYLDTPSLSHTEFWRFPSMIWN